MKKKLLIGIIALCIVSVCTTIISFAGFSQQTKYEVHKNGVICSLKTYDENAEGKVKIPEEYEGIMVTGIEEKAFLKCSGVTEVVVPKTVVNIGEYAMGYTLSDDGEIVKKENFVIWGRGNSEAQKFAEENGFTFKVLLTTPKLVSAKNAANGVRVTWVATENAAGYNIYRKTKTSGWSKIAYVEGEKTSTYVDVTAKNGVDYIYTVRASFKNELSGFDKAGVKVHHLTAPVVTLANVTDGVSISWTKNAKATAYRVYRKYPYQSSWTKIKTVKANQNSYTDVDAKGGKEANYCVIAVENSYTSGFEANKSILYLTAPKITSTKNTAQGVNITWNSVSGAKKYRVYHKVNGGSWVKIADVTGKNSYVDKNVTYGTKYGFTVKAICDKTTSGYVKNISYYRVEAPKLKKVEASSSGLKVSWGKVAKADYYSIHRRVDGGEWKRVGTTKNAATLSFTDKSVTSGIAYNYTVIAWYKNSKSTHDTKGVTGTYFSAPKITSGRCFKGQKVVVEWASVGGAQTYTIYKKVAGGSFQAIKTVNSSVLSYTDTSIKVGQEYSYIIRATSYYGIVSGNSNMKCVRAIDPKKPMVALTYDDGPSSSATTRILNTLEKYDARATFFVVGSRVDSYKSQIQRAYNLNCEIGNHTYNHKTLTSASASEIKNELNKTASKVEAITGERPVIMRPPGGSYQNDTVRKNVGAPIIMWSVDTRDWESRNASSIISNVKRNTYNGSIILMHDLYDSTASATETIVPWLVDNGYQIVTVTEMMDAKGITMKDGVAYNSAG